MTRIALQMLGQSGCRIEFDGTVIYMDPYLSNSVQELDAPDLKRLVDIPIQPEAVTDADWVIISHEHIDHCDPQTLPLIAQASGSCKFIGPPSVLRRLDEWGISSERCLVAEESWILLSASMKVRAVPAAHPVIERDKEGNLTAVGFIMEINDKQLYLAGDTSVANELIDTLMSLSPISAAILPVNEHNFYRGRRGIVGNMSIRDAFHLAEEVGIKTVIPVHWDMFEVNSVDLDEIQAVYRKLNPDFELQINPTSIVL